jgi:hypothetical protein
MDHKIILLLEKARRFLAKHGLQEVKWNKLNQEGISMREMLENFNSPKELVTNILQHERVIFEDIFNRYNFTNYSAIDVLLLVSKEVNENLFYINPTITLELRDLFPEIYDEHTLEREHLLKKKIHNNITNGIEQGIYKKDLNPEATTKLLWTKVINIYDKEALTGDGFSYTTIIEELLNSYIKMVANEDGLNYYRSRKQLYGVLGFGW